MMADNVEGVPERDAAALVGRLVIRVIEEHSRSGASACGRLAERFGTSLADAGRVSASIR
jgi:hypothetical protein